MLLDFIIVLFNASIFLLSTKYLQAHGYASAFLEKPLLCPSGSGKDLFWGDPVVLGITGEYVLPHERQLHRLLADLSGNYRDDHIDHRFERASYNGIVLLVFADILYNTKKIKYWPALLVVSFGLLIISDYAILSLIVRMPSIETYINFYPSGARTLILFFRNILASLNIVGFISFLATSLFVQQKEKQRVGRTVGDGLTRKCRIEELCQPD